MKRREAVALLLKHGFTKRSKRGRHDVYCASMPDGTSTSVALSTFNGDLHLNVVKQIYRCIDQVQGRVGIPRRLIGQVIDIVPEVAPETEAALTAEELDLVPEPPEHILDALQNPAQCWEFAIDWESMANKAEDVDWYPFGRDAWNAHCLEVGTPPEKGDRLLRRTVSQPHRYDLYICDGAQWAPWYWKHITTPKELDMGNPPHTTATPTAPNNTPTVAPKASLVAIPVSAEDEALISKMVEKLNQPLTQLHRELGLTVSRDQVVALAFSAGLRALAGK